MQTIAEYLPEHPFFAGLDESVIGARRRVRRATCTSAPGEHLFHEGEPADTFYVIRHGRVASRCTPPAGPPWSSTPPTTATSSAGRGWCRPYRWIFDARATEETSAIAFDGACLRGKCEADPAVGYALLQRVVTVMSTRLQSARMRLLDLYGAAT